MEENLEGVYFFSEDEREALGQEAEQVKAKHKVKKVHLIDVEPEDGDEKTYRAWLKKPDIKTMSAFFTLAQKEQTIEACKLVFNQCFLEGDREIVQDDEIFMSAMTQIEGLMKVRRARIANF